MPFRYDRLFQKMEEQNMTPNELRKAARLTLNTIAKMSKGEYVSLTAIDKICTYFHCKVEDIIEHVEE